MMHLDKLPNQREGEKMILFLRRHWFAPLTILVVSGLLLAFPFLVWFTFPEMVAEWMERQYIGPLLSLGLLMYIMAIWLVSWIEFTDYYLDTWIITNERILNIEQLGLFNRTASELHLTSIQDITSEIKGFLHTMFNYGSVYIQTAGETTRFNFKNIPHPDKVKDDILRLVEEDKRRHGFGQGTRTEIPKEAIENK